MQHSLFLDTFMKQRFYFKYLCSCQVIIEFSACYIKYLFINYVKVAIILGCYFTPFCVVNNFWGGSF